MTARFATPFADLFRSLTPAERKELAASIREHGVRVPVMVYTSAKHGPSIIDGMNRWEITQEAGIDCPVNDIGAVSDKQAAQLAEQLNHCRRHLSPADWRDMRDARAARVKRVAEKRKEGKSLRVIAEEEGVSAPQVLADLKVAEAGVKGLTPEPETPPEVKGKDGKTYKAAAKPSSPAPKAKAPKPVSQPESKPVGDPEPADSGAELVAMFDTLRTVVAAVQAAKRKVDWDAVASHVAAIERLLRGEG
jgi:ParB-like chromosome segregation protein Spo0J